MNTQTSSRSIQIHTQKSHSSKCGELIWYSVVQAKREDGCLDCKLQWDATGTGYWVIQGTWKNEDSMRFSFEQAFQPAIEKLIAHQALISIKVSLAENPSELRLTSRQRGSGADAYAYSASFG